MDTLILRTFLSLLLCLLSLSDRAYSADLDPEDVFFIGPFSRPRYITGYFRKVYIADGRSVLVFNQSENRWETSIPAEDKIQGLFYSRERNKLRILTPGGPREFDENFRQWYPADSLRFTVGDSGRLEAQGFSEADLSGISMPFPWMYTGGAIRDGYMTKAAVTRSVEFEYDRLWVLTAGMGIFRGSRRRGLLEPAWFGLDSPDTRSLFIHEGRIWFGSAKGESLVSASLDFQQWQRFPAGITAQFPDAFIRDMESWKGFYWLATGDGVIRLDAGREKAGNPDAFFRYGETRNLRARKILCLAVHAGLLYAGTDKGLFALKDPGGSFSEIPHPDIMDLTIMSLESGKMGVWVGSRYGLYQYLPGETRWVNPGQISLTKGLPVHGSAEIDSLLCWIQSKKALMCLEGNKPVHEEFRRVNLTHLIRSGRRLFCTYGGGVTVLNVDNHLSVDYTLDDGIMGTKVNAVLPGEKYIWVATDAGVTRVDGKRFLP